MLVDVHHDVLFFDRVRLPHLRAHAAVQNVTYQPSPLAFVDLDIPSTTFRRVVTRSCSAAVQVQVRSHSVSH